MSSGARRSRGGWDIEFDHIHALCNGGENRETNLAPILAGKPHREKTALDVAERVKTDRMRAKHFGLFPKPKRRLQGRGFEGRASADRTADRVGPCSPKTGS